MLPAFFPYPSTKEEVLLHSLDLIKALVIYLERTAYIRQVDFLFVTFGVAKRGNCPTRATLSCWVRSAISFTYLPLGVFLPPVVQGR